MKRIRLLGLDESGKLLLKKTPATELILHELQRLYPKSENDDFVCLLYDKSGEIESIWHLSKEAVKRLEYINVYGGARYIYSLDIEGRTPEWHKKRLSEIRKEIKEATAESRRSRKKRKVISLFSLDQEERSDPEKHRKTVQLLHICRRHFDRMRSCG